MVYYNALKTQRHIWNIEGIKFLSFCIFAEVRLTEKYQHLKTDLNLKIVFIQR